MGKSSKKKQQRAAGGDGRQKQRDLLQQKHQQLQNLLAEANGQCDPLASIPSAFLRVPLASSSPAADGGGGASRDAKVDNEEEAMILHYTSATLPSNMLKHCLDLFHVNMGEMYKSSSWGLDMGEKEKELTHPGARFLVVASPLSRSPGEVAAEPKNDGCNNDTIANDNTVDNDVGVVEEQQEHKVLAFAHFRYEPDDEDAPRHEQQPVTYLYELQVNRSYQKLGLGKRLMTIIELVSMKLRLKKVMLTVFHANAGAMAFYKKRKYVVDECSPSNFGEDADYEILSKPLGGS